MYLIYNTPKPVKTPKIDLFLSNPVYSSSIKQKKGEEEKQAVKQKKNYRILHKWPSHLIS